MKTNELREMTGDQIKEKINELEEESFNLRFQAKMGQLSNPVQMRYVKRDIARAKTLLKEKSGEKENKQ